MGKRSKARKLLALENQPSVPIVASTSKPSKRARALSSTPGQAGKKPRTELDKTEGEESDASNPGGSKEKIDVKGKGKAKEIDPNEDIIRLQKELEAKNATIQAQAILFSTIRSTMSCSICLEILTTPYSLVCGHIFCRGCLLVWFHRPDIREEENNSPAEASDDDEIVIEDPIQPIQPLAPIVIDNSSSSESDSDIEEIPRPEASRTLNRVKPAEGEITGRFEGRAFRVTGRDTEKVFSKMEEAMHRMAEELDSGSGSRASTLAAVQMAALEPSRVDSMRAARLARFDPDSMELNAAVNTAAGPNLINPEEIPAANRFSSPEAPPNNPAPTGQHRIANLVCPQCRDPVTQGPYRIFALSDLVVSLKKAESGTFRSGSAELPSASDHPTTKATNGLPPGMMNENDSTWAGLFNLRGVETAEERRARRAVVMRDVEDGVRRCGSCNWELDGAGICEGCGREWELSEGSVATRDSFDGRDEGFNDRDGFPVAPGYIYDEARSEDSRSEASSEDSFISKDKPPKKNRRRGRRVDSDSPGSVDAVATDESGSGSEVEIKTRRKNRILDSEEENSEAEEGIESIDGSVEIQDVESDDSDAEIVTRERRRIVIDSEEEDSE